MAQQPECLAWRQLCSVLEMKGAAGCACALSQLRLLLLTLFSVWISLYYAAFYVVMTGLFALCIYVLMQTIDPYTPDYQDQLKSPGKLSGGRWQRCWGSTQRGTAGPFPCTHPVQEPCSLPIGTMTPK